MGNCAGPPRTEETIRANSRNDKIAHKRNSQETHDNVYSSQISFDSYVKIEKTSNTSLQLIFPAIIEEFPLPIYLKRDEKITLIISGEWSFLSDKDFCDFKGHRDTNFNNHRIGQLMCRVQGGLSIPITNNKFIYTSDSNGQIVIWGNNEQAPIATYGFLDIKIEGTSQLTLEELNTALGWPLKIQYEPKPNYITEDEYELFSLINKIRVDPNFFAKQYLDKENEPNHTHFKETYEMLTNYTSVPSLELSQSLYQAAKDHTDDIGSKGLTGHLSSLNGSLVNQRIKKYRRKEVLYFGENCWYGKRIPLSILLDMIVDSGLRIKNNRLNILNGNFSHIGLSIGKHFAFQWICVIIFSNQGDK